MFVKKWIIQLGRWHEFDHPLALFHFTLLSDCETLILHPALPSADSGDQPMRMENKKVIPYYGRDLT